MLALLNPKMYLDRQVNWSAGPCQIFSQQSEIQRIIDDDCVKAKANAMSSGF